MSVVFSPEKAACRRLPPLSVYQVMFDGFNESNVASSSQYFFDKFMELKSIKASEYLKWKPSSTFATFCYSKYLQLVHPDNGIRSFRELEPKEPSGCRKNPGNSLF